MEKTTKVVVEDIVTYDELAISVGSGELEVYATPMVIALMENAAATLANRYIDEDCTTVGTMINIEHTSASPINSIIKAEATLVSVEGRKFTFNVVAFDDAGEIAKGTHQRFSVKSESFQEKTNNKFNK